MHPEYKKKFLVLHQTIKYKVYKTCMHKHKNKSFKTIIYITHEFKLKILHIIN